MPSYPLGDSSPGPAGSSRQRIVDSRPDEILTLEDTAILMGSWDH